MSITMDAQARDALERAFQASYVPLLRLMVLLAGRQDVAEDIVQETFLRLASRIEALPGDEAVRYARRIALNLWKRRLRRISLERRHLHVVLPDEMSAQEPGERVAAREAMWRAVARLPKKQRVCLVLRYYEDLPYAEIASLVRSSTGAVKSNLSRGLARLRKEFPDDP